MQNTTNIAPEDLTCMDMYDDMYHYRVELAYAREDNLLFEERIYRKDAHLWLHKDLALVVQKAALLCIEEYNLRFILHDGLRTVEAQEAMMHTQRVRDNPHWLEEPRLLSSPGGGGHPRGMAIDIGLESLEGELLNMGCAFDYLAEDPSQEHNPAHRNYRHTADIRKNRNILDSCMEDTAQALGIPLFPLPEEWWDFRLPHTFYSKYTPISEQGLPQNMRLLATK